MTGPDQVIYKYFLDNADAPAVFPLTAGNGSYIVLAFENVGGDQYVSLLTHSLTLELKSEFLPFLYPNQYVDFSEDNEEMFASIGNLNREDNFRWQIGGNDYSVTGYQILSIEKALQCASAFYHTQEKPSCIEWEEL